MMKDKLKFKKLLNEFRSLEYEFEYNNELLKEMHEHFQCFSLKWCEENGVDLDKLKEEQKKQVQNIFQNHDKQHAEMHGRFETNKKKTKHKEVFKSVAKKMHPDVVGEENPEYDELKSAFQKAVGALEAEQWGELFDVVEKYDIDIPNYEEANSSISKDIERMNEKIKNQKNTYSWLLESCEDNEDCKELVIKTFLGHVYSWTDG